MTEQIMCDECKKIIVKKSGISALTSPSTFHLEERGAFGMAPHDFCNLVCCYRWLDKKVVEITNKLEEQTSGDKK